MNENERSAGGLNENGTPQSTVICHICGTSIGDVAERVVLCRRCRVPSHRECWDFNGGCGVYGCCSTECEDGTISLLMHEPHVTLCDLDDVPCRTYYHVIEAVGRRGAFLARHLYEERARIFSGQAGAVAVMALYFLQLRNPFLEALPAAVMLVLGTAVGIAVALLPPLARRSRMTTAVLTLAMAALSYHCAVTVLWYSTWRCVAVAMTVFSAILFANNAIAWLQEGGRFDRGRWRRLVSRLARYVVCFLVLALLDVFTGRFPLTIHLSEIATVSALSLFAAFPDEDEVKK